MLMYRKDNVIHVIDFVKAVMVTIVHTYDRANPETTLRINIDVYEIERVEYEYDSKYNKEYVIIYTRSGSRYALESTKLKRCERLDIYKIIQNLVASIIDYWL